MRKILEDFFSVRSLITLGAFYTIYWLVWHGQPVPEVVTRIADMLLGYWFGSKVASALQKKDPNGAKPN